MIALGGRGDALLLLQKQRGGDAVNGGCVARSVLVLPYGRAIIRI